MHGPGYCGVDDKQCCELRESLRESSGRTVLMSSESQSGIAGCHCREEARLGVAELDEDHWGMLRGCLVAALM